MYAITAPGLSCIVDSWEDLERIQTLYPYPRWYKGRDKQDCQEWLTRNVCDRRFTGFAKYGNTYWQMYLKTSYHIVDGIALLEFDCSKVGYIRPVIPSVVYEHKGNMLYARMPNLKLDNRTVNSHMIALYYILRIAGPYIDVDLSLPYYGVYYALKYGDETRNRNIRSLRDLIRGRVGSVSYTLPLLSCLPEEVVNEQ